MVFSLSLPKRFSDTCCACWCSWGGGGGGDCVGFDCVMHTLVFLLSCPSDDSKKKKKKKKEKGKPAEDPKKKKGGKKPNAVSYCSVVFVLVPAVLIVGAPHKDVLFNTVSLCV